MKGKVIISTSSFAKFDKKPLDMLEKEGLSVEMNPFGRKLSAEEISGLLSDADFLIAGTEPLTREVLAGSKNLKVISRCGTGLDNVDLKAAEELGIKVFNTPDAPAQSVAELTVGLIFSLLRCIPLMDRGLREGVWQKKMGNLIAGKRIGIIGLGRIGRKVAAIFSSIGADVGYTDITEIKDASDYRFMNIKDLIVWADVITIHSGGTKDGKPLLGDEEIALMQGGKFIINTGRGGLVDEGALATAIKEGRVAGAALDVFKNEPYDGPLVKMDEVILTPHVGSYAVEARISMEIEATQNLLKGMEGKEK